MSYRKIEVDGVKYRYSVGSSHVKIVLDGKAPKGFKPSTIVATHSQILGIPQETIDKERAKGGDRCSHYGCEVCVPSTIISVRPETVADYIRKLKA